ncbi:hypothetical protein PVAND_011160 [Polypedilum vanderplanki]|uniref:Deoxynucleoside kinase domain-containing protein n=1 Tax=Polypedilum vanderplanki TaxID=319348 RepID=A0A9J6CIQ8_POLVA|nr:hypothetical protein PVAND_011160 [Polypedilum vanderplanki]
MSSLKKTVFIEGNTASGKSTLLKYFQKFDEILVLQEDIEKWTNFHGYNLLELKYKNPDFFQFPFQSYATLTRLRQHLQNSNKAIKMMERSLFSARHIFVEAQKNLNLMHEGNYHVLQEWYDYIDEYHKIQTDLFIYIQTDPYVAFKRIQERARKEEKDITFEYLKKIHQLHEELFIERANILPGKVLVIDGNLNQTEMMEEFKKCEYEIFSFIES